MLSELTPRSLQQRLIFYHASNEQSARRTPEKLRQFAAKTRPPFRSPENSMSTYSLEFMRKAGSLVTDGKPEMLEAEVNSLFYQGLPRKLRAAIKPSLETAQGNRTQRP